jgi:hypothetical protein
MTGGSPAAIITGKLTKEPPPAIASGQQSGNGNQAGVLHARKLAGQASVHNWPQFGADRNDSA